MTIKHHLWIGSSAVLILVWGVGCAQVPRQGGFDQTRDMVMKRTGQHVVWRQGGPEDKKVDAAIAQMLQGELSVAQSVGLAFLNNRQLQAMWEELSITQADVVQTGLLKNPSFGLLTRWPSRSAGTGSNIEMDLMFDFVDLALMPLRKQLAEMQFEQVKLRVAHEVIDLARRVRESYYTLQSAQQVHQMRLLAFEASDVSYELARRMHEAGNLSDLELEREQGLLEQNRVEVGKAELEVAVAREAMSRLLGLYGSATQFRVASKLPGLPEAEPAMDQLESLAVDQRLDLGASLRETQALAAALGVTRDYRFLVLTEIGVDSERDLDGTWVTGPHFQLEVPIFDQKQADIAKAKAQLRQGENRLWAMAVHVRSEVREARDRMLASRKLAIHFRDVIIPLHERIVQHTTEQYNYMLVGVFETIAARENEYAAYKEYIEAVRDYWIARSQLAAAVGGRIPNDLPQAETPASAPDPSPPPPDAGQPAPAHEHHHEAS